MPGAKLLVFFLVELLALLPELFAEWSLSHSDAGWLSGIFFAAYAASVPVLVTLTDRVPAGWG